MTNEMTERIASAIGKSTEETKAMLDRNPKLKKLLSEMNEQDAQKLMSILGDKESVAKILSSPQAKMMMEGMAKKDKQ